MRGVVEVVSKPLLIIGDTQQAKPQLDFVKRAAERFGASHTLWFLGDTLDSWTSKPLEQVETLKLILDLCEQGHGCTWSNHDAGYAWPALNGWCSGWNASTAAMVCHGPNAERMRKLFRGCLFSEEHNVLATHAGLSLSWLQEIAGAIDKLELPNTLDAWATDFDSPYWWIGRARGGLDPAGGPLWCDWEREFIAPNLGITQVVGHSHGSGMRLKTSEDGSVVYNIDCLGEDEKHTCLEVSVGGNVREVEV